MITRIFRISWMIALLIICSSCGYKVDSLGQSVRCRSVSVPYVEGDWDGSLTSALIKHLCRSGIEYRNQGGDLQLLVRLIEVDDENIGFRYDRHRDGKLKKSIIPVETRMIAWADVSLVDFITSEVVLGPERISASIDFDHDYYSSRDGVNVFSLGQLIDYDAAYDAAERPLYDKLAQKIVDFINDSW